MTQYTTRALNPNLGIISWYRKELLKLVREMANESMKTLADVYREGYTEIAFDESISSQARIALNLLKRKYGEKFDVKSKELAEKLTKKSKNYTTFILGVALVALFSDDLGSDYSKKVKTDSKLSDEVLKAIRFENVSLIKSLPERYFTRITGTIARSIENGEGIKWLRSELKKYKGMSEREAKIIAEDQTRKAQSSILRAKARELGVNRFKWIYTNRSADPREYHKYKLDGKIFEFDNPPIINPKTGERGMPAQLPNCKCTYALVFDF